jgi:hypothetical protein
VSALSGARGQPLESVPPLAAAENGDGTVVEMEVDGDGFDLTSRATVPSRLTPTVCIQCFTAHSDSQYTTGPRNWPSR